MKKVSVFFLMLLLSFLFFLGQSTKPQVEGKSVFPLFANNGDFVFLFEKEDKGIALGKQKNPWQNEVQQEILLVEGIASSPSLKRDKQKRMWAIWEGQDSGRMNVYLAYLEGDRLKCKEKVNKDFGGDNLSPSFEFDLNGNAWVTWINNFNNLTRVLVKDMKNGRTWQVNSPNTFTAYTPRIAIGRMNTVWIFWVSIREGQNEIFCNCFDGNVWSEQYSLNRKSHYPHISPEVCVDMNGYPWVVWSAYDGTDYEIWYSSWDGMRWSTESRITDNKRISDVFPFIAFLPENIPLVVWSQMGTKSQIFLKYRLGEDWSRDIKISGEDGWNRNPRLAVSHNKIGIVWENVKDSKPNVQTRILFSLDMNYPERKEKKARHFPKRNHFFSKKIHSSFFKLTSNDLDDKEYIAFGDSITYGVISRTWFPDKGYVPRLEHLLREEFIPAVVLNRGIPGEQTLEGLARLETVIIQDKSKYILIMEGTNDMSGGIPSETAAFNIEEMINKCIQSGVFPLVATIIPRSDELWHFGVRKRTLLFNELINEIVPSHFLPLVDQYNVFMDYPDGFRALFSDGAHPNESGYELMAEAWLENIKKIPLPPANLHVERKINKLLFFDEHINIITWEMNPLFPLGVQLAKYHIFRKKDEESDDKFEIIASVPADTFLFMDRNVINTQIYRYNIQTEDIEGIRGPVSSSVIDR